MADKFVLSVGLAHELEIAFRRNGWTTIDVKRLTTGNVLAEVLRFLGPAPGDISQESLAKLKDTPIIYVFTKDQAKALGYATNVNRRFLNFGLFALESKFGGRFHPFDASHCGTIGQLVLLTEEDLVRQPNVRTKVVEYVKAVLALHNLRLGMPVL